MAVTSKSMRGRKHHNSRRSRWRAGYSETGQPGSEGGHAEKDLTQAPRCVADPTRGVREQFLVEVTDTTAEQLAEQGLSPAAALLELNALFTAWVESVYHHSVHSETGQTQLRRWDDGWQAAGHGPAMASADALTEAFLWSQWRVVTKTATVSLHGNTYQVEPVLVGRKVELVFSPFNLEVIAVHYRDAHYGRAVPP